MINHGGWYDGPNTADQTLRTRGSCILESTSTTISALLNENHQFLQEMVIVCILFTAVVAAAIYKRLQHPSSPTAYRRARIIHRPYQVHDRAKKTEAMQSGTVERKMGVREWRRFKRISQGSVGNGVVRSYGSFTTSLQHTIQLKWLTPVPLAQLS